MPAQHSQFRQKNRPSPANSRPAGARLTEGQSRPVRAATQQSRCACGGSCPRCQPARLPGHDFSQVRIHPDAPQITAPLRARAVTLGQDIYFHPGHYRPGTPDGENLLAHELAHTLQTRHAVSRRDNVPRETSRPGDTLERNAEALARGETTHIQAAPANMALRAPLDGEGSDDTARRERLVQYIHLAEANLIRLLQTGGLLTGEEVTAERGGVRGVIAPASTLGRSDENFISYSDRNRIIRRIIRNLVAMITFYRTHPIPGSLPAAAADENNTFSTVIANPQGSSSYGASDADLTQLQAAYELYLITEGVWNSDSSWIDQIYIDTRRSVTPGAARGAPRIGRGVQSGAYMVFPNIDDEPLNYWRLDGYTAIPEGATIVEFWHDDIGYYYMHGDERIDVPSPWSSDRSRSP